MAHHDSGDEIRVAQRSKAATLVALAFALSFLLVATALAGSVGRVCSFLLAAAVFVAPGIPLARLCFARSERLLAGGALGYLLSSLLASGMYRWARFELWTVAGACLSLALILQLALWRATPPPEVEQERSESGSSGAGWLVAAMALAMALVALPFMRVGELTSEGVAYRAYFSADLMTHLSVVAELQKQQFPPENPFYAGRPLAYYWLFFVFPSLLGPRLGNQQALLLTYLSGAVLFAGLAFATARRLAAPPLLAFLAVAAGLAAASFEGLAALTQAAWQGEPLTSFRDMNLDAFSRWAFELTSLDGLHRSLLYTPQHLFSYSLLLLLCLIVLRGGPRAVSSCLLAGGLLGGMAGASIVTAMLAGPWLVLVRLSRGGRPVLVVRDLALVALASLVCLIWYFHLGFFGEAGAALILRRPQLLDIPALALLDCGPLLILSWPALGQPRARPLVLLGGMAAAAVLGLDIRGYEGVWMAWRAGSVLLVALLLLAAAGIGRWSWMGRGLVLLPALLTTGFDVYNAQDIRNRNPSRGEFRWTTVVSQPEIEALGWIRSETPRLAVVQWDARARERGEWALIPALAERRMSVGFPIFLLDLRRYRARERREIRSIFTSPDAETAYRLAKAARIDYLFVGRQELAIRGDRVRKLWEAPEYFRPVFANQQVTVFEVR
ncbi:MAG: hypothetical protein ACE5JI_06705 [Acidobacteriota bacterium]